MPEEIRTERLLLRRAMMADLAPMHALLTNPIAMRYWSSPPHDNLAASETWLRSMVDADPVSSDDFILEHEGQVIGKLGCWQLPEIGFLVEPAVWGRGLASEAIAAFLDRRRGMNCTQQITADVDPRNERSLRLLRKHGFLETGRAARTWCIAGEWCDSVYLELKL